MKERIKPLNIITYVQLFLSLCIVLSIFSSCVKSRPKMPGSSDLVKANRCMKTNDNLSAINLFTSAIEKGLSPKFDVIAHLERGMAYDRVFNIKNALDDYSYAIEHKNLLTNKSQSVCYAVRAQIYQNINEYDRAEEDILKANDLSVNNKAVYSIQGKINLINGNFETALKNAGSVIKYSPSDPYGYLLSGSIFEIQGKYEDAFNSFNMMKRYSKDKFYNADIELSDVLYMKGDLEGALKYLNGIDEKNITPAIKKERYGALVQILNELNRKQEMTDELKEAENYLNGQMLEEPYNIYNYSGLASIYDEANVKIPDALILCKKALKMDYPSRIYGTVAWSYYKNHEYKEAEKYMLLHLENSPVDTWNMYRLGLIYRDESDMAKAKEIWNKVLKINPDHRFVLKELSKIK